MKRRAFSLVEALLALSLISLVLGLVAQGLNKMTRINVASQESSARIEMWSALQRLTSEVSGALTVALPNPQTIQMTRVDPTLNLQYNESRGRLPWPWPPPTSLAPGVLDPNRAPFVVSIQFFWQASTGSIVEQGPNGSQSLVSGLADWKVSKGVDGRMLQIELLPKAGARSLQTLAYLPMVAP